MNVRKITVSTDKETYGISLRAEPDHKTLGARLKGDFKTVTQKIKALSDKECQDIISKGTLEMLGHTIDLSELRFIFQSTGSNEKYEAHSDNDVLILLDVSPDQEMMDEGIAREIINRVQKLRKKAHLVPTDEINVYYSVSDNTSEIQRIAVSHKSYIENAIKAPLIEKVGNKVISNLIMDEIQELKGVKLSLFLTAGGDVKLPETPWANVTLVDLSPRYGAKSTNGMVLLKTFDGKATNVDTLLHEITTIFGLYGINFNLWLGDRLLTDKDISNISGKTIYASVKKPNNSNDSPAPYCKFINKELNGKQVTYIIENPCGNSITNYEK